VERAGSTHLTLIDRAHVLGELLGVVNVPSGVWLDEAGLVVRPPEPAWARDPHYELVETPPDASPERVEAIAQVRQLRIQSEEYVVALRDWVRRGAASPYALTPLEIERRTGHRSAEAAEAAACFELGQHLQRTGSPQAAVPYFRHAHRLQPENWTYKRQAWALSADPGVYDGNWLADIKRSGAENYYPALELS